ncbi:cupredoxin domain-containing protein [Paenibacillus glycinis]|uniref:EfeO-type cupredoxin-like domain-containing protein n=1 Tax=Paenibacillus glycinis TaxID=2697035 RepID=A0ABW9XT40_9BACL|nr:cupredoxin domain-containing protein [Paenibacillus glycinis]NBD25701.1 hypothetical protein [Paenibacillus glycinis]
MIHKKLVRTCLVAVALTGVLSACSGKTNDTEATSGNASAGASSAQTVKIDMNEFSFSLAEVTVKHGDTVHFVLSNTGTVPHDMNSEELKLDQDVDPGKTAEFDWTAPDKTGTYKVICDKPNHMEQGMTMNLIVN